MWRGYNSRDLKLVRQAELGIGGSPPLPPRIHQFHIQNMYRGHQRHSPSVIAFVSTKKRYKKYKIK
jgi:hypothetical protein